MIEVALAADAAYRRHAAACAHSFLEHGAERVHLLHPPGTRIRRMPAGVVAHEVRAPGLPAAGHVSATMWLRVFLPEVLADRPRVLYVDCDTIACDDLRPLWGTDLGGAAVGAVDNVFEPWNAQHPARLGLTSYFNSGVLLLDLDRVRGLSGQVLRVVARRDLTWPDQDALNLVLGGRRAPLHPRWNAMNSVMTFDHAAAVLGEREVAEARARPGIRHFEGPGRNKPWHRRCPFPQRGEYRRHRRATRWS